MKHFYVYYSYEEYGKGYIGKRECKCLPEEDVSYFGSFTDKTFNPTQKIILETFNSVEEALEAECALHNFYEVDKNPHFANKAKQTSTKFYLTEKQASEFGKKSKELKVGIHALTREQKREAAKMGDKTAGGKKTTSQKWKCLETGFITSPGSLSNYQIKRGIDTSKRIKMSG